MERCYLAEWVKLFEERGFEAAAAINFVTKFRLTVPLEKMEERWKAIPNIDRSIASSRSSGTAYPRRM